MTSENRKLNELVTFRGIRKLAGYQPRFTEIKSIKYKLDIRYVYDFLCRLHSQIVTIQ
jgi:hypothetical protein